MWTLRNRNIAAPGQWLASSKETSTPSFRPLESSRRVGSPPIFNGRMKRCAGVPYEEEDEEEDDDDDEEDDEDDRKEEMVAESPFDDNPLNPRWSSSRRAVTSLQ